MLDFDRSNVSGFQELIMECLYFKAQMKRGTAPFNIDRNGYHFSWDAIPAWVCEQCGESLFETQEVDTIQAALTVLDRETVSLVARV
jgi:YgiT-type zinc finger domain-containing protein